MLTIELTADETAALDTDGRYTADAVVAAGCALLDRTAPAGWRDRVRANPIWGGVREPLAHDPSLGEVAFGSPVSLRPHPSTRCARSEDALPRDFGIDDSNRVGHNVAIREASIRWAWRRALAGGAR